MIQVIPFLLALAANTKNDLLVVILLEKGARIA